MNTHERLADGLRRATVTTATVLSVALAQGCVLLSLPLDDGGEDEADDATADGSEDTGDSGDTSSGTSSDTDSDTDSDLDATATGSSEDTSEVNSCEALAADYELLMADDACVKDSGCKAISDHCWAGLGDCWRAVSVAVDEGQVEDLVAEYVSLACAPPIDCDCAPTPPPVACIASVCTMAEAGLGQVRVLHLANEAIAGDFGFDLEPEPTFVAIAQGAGSAYANLIAGEHTIEAYVSGADWLAADWGFALAADSKLSVALGGNLENFGWILVDDDDSAIPAGHRRLRISHANPLLAETIDVWDTSADPTLLRDALPLWMTDSFDLPASVDRLGFDLEGDGTIDYNYVIDSLPVDAGTNLYMSVLNPFEYTLVAQTADEVIWLPVE